MLYIAAVAVITGSLLVKSQTISETAQLISQLDISRMSNVQSPTYSNWSTVRRRAFSLSPAFNR